MAHSVQQAPAGSRVEMETARLLAGPLDRLNFGCGPFPLAGWTNIDNGDGEWYDAPADDRVIQLDLFEALAALPDAVATRVYSEHLFEHFTLEQGHRILREWSRVLGPGGVVRIVCPDLEAEAKLFLRQIAPAPDEVIDRHRLKWLGKRYQFQPGERLTRAMVLNYGMWLDGHKFVYDAATLEQSMRLAGFEKITRREFGESTHADLRAIDSHDGGETGRGWIPKLALVMEGTKPATGAAAAHSGHAAVRRNAPIPTPAPHEAPDPARADVARKARESRKTAPAPDAALKRRLVEVMAELCAARGHRRIALYGAGQHTAPIVREPWRRAGVEVVAVLDDAPKIAELGGVRVCRPAELATPIDAVVVSSDAFEREIFEKASAFFGPRAVPVVQIYGDA